MILYKLKKFRGGDRDGGGGGGGGRIMYRT